MNVHDRPTRSHVTHASSAWHMAHRELATCSTGRPQKHSKHVLCRKLRSKPHMKDPVLRTNSIKLTEVMGAGVEEGGGAARSGGKGQKGEEVAT